jgi:transposase
MRERELLEENKKLRRMVDELQLAVSELRAELSRVAQELAKARKDSSTSSKPPSSDVVKPQKRGKKGSRKGSKKRKQGGQPGHPKHDRKPFTQEEIDKVIDHLLEACPDCNGDLEPADLAPRVTQHVEVVERPVHIEEHRGYAFWCPTCEKIHYAPFPPGLKAAGLAGPRLTALVAFMKGVCHASFSTIRKFFRDVVGVKVSRGYLRKLLGKVSDALEAPYVELRKHLPSEHHLNVDETGHKNNGERFWTWCFRAASYTVFKVDKSRGSQVLIEMLGQEFKGVLGCDYFSAYRKYMGDFGVPVQFCLAHLIRDVKFLTQLPDAKTNAFGGELLKGLRRLFRVIHRRDELTEKQFQSRLLSARRALLAMAALAPDTREAQNLAKRFEEHGAAYFQFITTPDIDPTNNLAEQAIRFVVIDRRVTQGTRSEGGQRWSERIWTVIATCAQQGRSAFDFLEAAIRARFTGTAAPSLLPDTS